MALNPDYWVVRIYPWDTSGEDVEWSFTQHEDAAAFAEHLSKLAADNEHWFAGSGDPNARIAALPQHFATLEQAIGEARGLMPEADEEEEEDDDEAAD